MAVAWRLEDIDLGVALACSGIFLGFLVSLIAVEIHFRLDATAPASLAPLSDGGVVVVDHGEGPDSEAE